MQPLTNRAKEILKLFPQISERPASLSGRHHQGDTVLEHLEKTAKIMQLLCESLNINDEDTDMLVACAYLHDLGSYLISCKGRTDLPFYTFYKETGWSRLDYAMKVHPVLSAAIINELDIDRKEEIKRIVATHMAHWYKDMPQPATLYEKLLIIADFLSTKYSEDK